MMFMSLSHYHKRFLNGYNSCGKYFLWVIMAVAVISFIVQLFWTDKVLFISLCIEIGIGIAIIITSIIVQKRRQDETKDDDSDCDIDEDEFFIM